jgi:AraC-like DNA-binding protein
MSAPLFRHSRRLITEPGDFDDAVTGIDLKVDFQRRQERASRVEQFQSESWALDFGEAHVRTRVRGVLRGGWGSFCLALGPGEAVWNGQPAGPGSLGLLPPGDEVDGRASADFAWLTAAVPPDVWNRCVALAGRDAEPGRLTVLRLPAAVMDPVLRGFRACQRRLGRAVATSAEARLAADEAAGLVSQVFTTACEQAGGMAAAPDSLRNRARLTRRAESWMLDHLAEPVQVPDLCLALRVSRRELEYAFRTILDESPRDHFEALRLNAIRRALKRSDRPVIEVAFSHGIQHLGRFAARYRALFGENPGATRRSRSTHGMEG